MAIMRLRELIDTLARKDPAASVVFDFVYFHPKGLHSYRGDYSHLAVGYFAVGDPPTVEAFHAELLDANGKTFTGYKGGEYDMHDKTPVWVANSSETGSTGIVDVIEFDGQVVLKTAKCDW